MWCVFWFYVIKQKRHAQCSHMLFFPFFREATPFFFFLQQQCQHYVSIFIRYYQEDIIRSTNLLFFFLIINRSAMPLFGKIHHVLLMLLHIIYCILFFYYYYYYSFCVQQYNACQTEEYRVLLTDGPCPPLQKQLLRDCNFAALMVL